MSVTLSVEIVYKREKLFVFFLSFHAEEPDVKHKNQEMCLHVLERWQLMLFSVFVSVIMARRRRRHS